MNSQRLAALLSSLISQLLTLLLLIFPPSNSLTIPNSISPPFHNFQDSIFPLLQHFITTSNFAAFVSFSRKRKRAQFQALADDDGDDEESERRIDRFGSVMFRNPDSFKQFFRMKASTFEWLCGLLEPLLDCRDPIDSPLDLSGEIRLGIGLFRLATGADYPEISSRFGVSEADSKFCVKQLCRVLCTNYRFWVGFPSNTELDSVSARFETLTGMPNCCGIVNCIRFNVEIADEIGSVAENVGNTESIAAQIVVDSSSRILNVIAGFSGNKSDLQILKSSSLCKDIEKGVILNSRRPINVNDVSVPQYLIGNGGYNMFSWLLLPFTDPEPGSVEENFNKAHRLMCVSSLKAIASLRNWGVLSRPMKMEHKIAVACIGACSILHNMLIMREDYSAFCNELDDKELNDPSVVSLPANLIEEKVSVIRKVLATRAKESAV